jgi:hypothetical protein
MQRTHNEIRKSRIRGNLNCCEQLDGAVFSTEDLSSQSNFERRELTILCRENTAYVIYVNMLEHE